MTIVGGLEPLESRMLFFRACIANPDVAVEVVLVVDDPSVDSRGADLLLAYAIE